MQSREARVDNGEEEMTRRAREEKVRRNAMREVGGCGELFE
jgi:hypothetical protein